MGTTGQAAQLGRTQGIEDALRKSSAQLQIVAKQTASWQRDEAKFVSNDWLESYPDLNIILANNDEMAIGAVLAAREMGIKDEDLIIGGIDSSPEAAEFLGKGLDFTVLQSAVEQGRMAAEAAYRWAQGKKADKWIWIPFELVVPGS